MLTLMPVLKPGYDQKLLRVDFDSLPELLLLDSLFTDKHKILYQDRFSLIVELPSDSGVILRA